MENGLDHRIRSKIVEHYNVSQLLRSWFHHARENYRTYITQSNHSATGGSKRQSEKDERDDEECGTSSSQVSGHVRLKKYFHVIRPLLSIRWVHVQIMKQRVEGDGEAETIRPFLFSGGGGGTNLASVRLREFPPLSLRDLLQDPD